MPFFIEIIGPPGSGKTFVSNNLEKYNSNYEKIFYHSNLFNLYNKYNKTNFFRFNLIKLKIFFRIFFYYIIFIKRFFLKKIYKNNYFFRMTFLLYKNLLSIEILKENLPKEKYIIMEPGPIMFFLQDYFYVNEDLSLNEIKLFNKLFFNYNILISLNCNKKTILERLNNRKRGLPVRMKNLNKSQVDIVIEKSIKITDFYTNSANKLCKIIKIDSSLNIDKINETIIKSIK